MIEGFLPGMPVSTPEKERCKADWDRVMNHSNLLPRVAVVKLLHDHGGELSAVEKPKRAAICDAVAVVSPYGMDHNDREAYLALAGILSLPPEADRVRHRLPSKEAVQKEVETERLRFISRLEDFLGKLRSNDLTSGASDA